MKIKGIVFSGGGLRGFAFIGCLKALEECDIIATVEFYAGCSIGSIMAAMISVGYTSSELYDFILHFDYETVKELNILGFLDNYGIETGNRILEFLRLMLKRKTGIINPTFLQLYQMTGRHLVVNATCINTHSIEYFDYKNNPDMPVALALRMSISLPFWFVPVAYKGKLYVDGGVIDNFPVHIWEKPEEVLGFKLGHNQNEADTINSFISFAQHTWGSFDGELTRMKMNSVKDYPIVTIPVTCVHSFNLIVTKQQRIQIYNQGYKTTKKFLKEYLSRSDRTIPQTPNLVREILDDLPESFNNDENEIEPITTIQDYIKLDNCERILNEDTITLKTN